MKEDEKKKRSVGKVFLLGVLVESDGLDGVSSALLRARFQNVIVEEFAFWEVITGKFRRSMGRQMAADFRLCASRPLGLSFTSKP